MASDSVSDHKSQSTIIPMHYLCHQSMQVTVTVPPQSCPHWMSCKWLDYI